jgi:threonyl-tRNA synthetase
MPNVTLPDGTVKSYDQSLTVAEVASSIGSGLAKAAIAGEVDGQLVDTSFMIEGDSDVAIITNKDEKALEVIRHSTAHLLAQATQQIYPKAQVTIGPVIDNGFYYDFAYKEGFSEQDLAKIEKKMNAIVKQNLPIERMEMTREEAVKFFKSWVSTTRQKSLSRFQPMKFCLFTSRETLWIFVEAPMCLPRVNSKPLSS